MAKQLKENYFIVLHGMDLHKKVITSLFYSFIFIYFLSGGSIAYGEEKDYVVLQEKGWKITKEGYQYKTLIGKHKESTSSFELIFLKFNPYKFNLKIIPYSSIATYPVFVNRYTDLKKKNIAIINGGYFDERGKHLGFLKINNKIYRRNVATHPIYSGIILPDAQKKIIHSSLFNPKQHKNAIQVGPLLIRDGKVNPGLKNTESVHYRSGLGIDNDGDFILFATNTNYGGISWKTLVNILKGKGFDFINVINLDGGGSTQLFFKKNGKNILYRGIKAVPTALLVELRE
ncbi:MAG: phosphodiester glycosidase family protein [Nitrospinae bacterium]|nr:phosphodiester glycosidase family protein [Nitrospinota bacterium]